MYGAGPVRGGTVTRCGSYGGPWSTVTNQFPFCSDTSSLILSSWLLVKVSYLNLQYLRSGMDTLNHKESDPRQKDSYAK